MTTSVAHRLSIGWFTTLLVCAIAGTGSAEQAGNSIASASVAAFRIKHTHMLHRKGKWKMDKFLVYVGTYTGGKSKGIYRLELDTATGALTEKGVTSGVDSPSFLAIHPNHHFLYAVNEIDAFRGTAGGALSAFSIQPKTGELKLLNQQSTRGGGPCFVSVDRQGKHAFVANYGGGSIAAFPIQEDGSLEPASAFVQHEGSGANKERQQGPHAHSIYPDAAGHFVYAADLGLDKILVYRLDENKGTLSPNTPPFTATAPGAGPRHLAFHPNGRNAYAINEINSTVAAYHYDSHAGTLTVLQTLSTLPEGFPGDNNTTAEVQVHPSGKFLYGSNRGHNSIVIYSIDAETGRLHLIGHQSTEGKIPRNFAIDPTGNYLLAANQSTDNIVVFRIDTHTGKLTPTGHSIEIPQPVSLVFLSEK